MLHGNVRMFDVIFKKMEAESSRAAELVLEDHSVFLVRNTILNVNSPKRSIRSQSIDRFSVASCCSDFFKT